MVEEEETEGTKEDKVDVGVLFWIWIYRLQSTTTDGVGTEI